MKVDRASNQSATATLRIATAFATTQADIAISLRVSTVMPLRLIYSLVLFHSGCLRGSRVLFTLYALKLGAQPLAVGFIAAAFAIGPIALSWHAGRVIDRYRPRTVMRIAGAGTLLAMLLPYFVPTLSSVFVAGAIIGITSTYFNLSMQNMVGHLSAKETRARNYSTYSMFVSTAGIVGPIVVGVSIDQFGLELAFPCTAALVTPPLLFLTLWGSILPKGEAKPAAPGAVRGSLFNRQIWPVIAASSVAQTGLETFAVYMPVYGNAIGLSASAIGTIVACSQAGGFVARLLLPSVLQIWGEQKALAYALILGAVGASALPLFEHGAVLALLALLFGSGLNSTQPIVLNQMYARSPAGRSGEALGLRFALDNGVRCMAPVVFGAIASVSSVSLVFWLSAILIGAGGMVASRDSGKREGAMPPDRGPSQ